MRRAFLISFILTTSCDALLGTGQFTFDAATPPKDGGGDECIGPNGCWACTPTTNDQFLNACDLTCTGFDRSRVVPYLTADGGLPALPTPSDAGPDVTADAPSDTGGGG